MIVWVWQQAFLCTILYSACFFFSAGKRKYQNPQSQTEQIQTKLQTNEEKMKQDDQQRDEQKLHLAYDPNCLFVVFTTVVVDQIK